MTEFLLKRLSDLTSENSFFKMEGFSGEAAPDSTTNIDWQFPEERWLSGGSFIAVGSKWGDRASLQLVQIVNGEDVAVRTFVADIVLSGEPFVEIKVDVPYIRLIPQGLYIRISYVNVDPYNSVKAGLNLITHIPSDIEE